jgi:DNA topoisomerase-1
VLDHQQLKLYTLIWNRTMATQMRAAQFKRVAANITAKNYGFRATGQTVLFDGFLRLYSEGKDEPHDARTEQEADGEKILPPLSVGEKLGCEKLAPEQHFTKPPPRYTEASLVKKLEEEGIGRPSTYAPTISTVQARGYIKKDGKQLAPEDIAFTVTDLLVEHFPQVADITFTAQMEQSLDNIAEGDVKEVDFLKNFYGPFKALVDAKTKEIKKTDVLKERVIGIDPATGLEVIARTGRFGPYVQLGRLPEGEKKKKTAKGKKKDPAEKAAEKAEKSVKTASLPKNASVDDVTMEEAMSLLQFPKTLGEHGGEAVTVSLGRFGPYIRIGKQTAAIPAEIQPAAVTLPMALQIVSESSERKKQAALPLRTFGKDPVSGGDIFVKAGRYGPYVTDGTTNVSIPKAFTPETITEQDAKDLLEKKRKAPKRAWKGKKKG